MPTESCCVMALAQRPPVAHFVCTVCNHATCCPEHWRRCVPKFDMNGNPKEDI